MHHFKLSAYNSNVQRIKNRYKKNLKKSIDNFKLSAYNRSIQEIRKKNKKNFKKYASFLNYLHIIKYKQQKQVNQFSI